jgi:hypothetical protein
MKIATESGWVKLTAARRDQFGREVTNYKLTVRTETTTSGCGWTMLRGKPHLYTCLIDQETLGVVHDPWTLKLDLNIVVRGEP